MGQGGTCTAHSKQTGVRAPRHGSCRQHFCCWNIRIPPTQFKITEKYNKIVLAEKTTEQDEKKGKKAKSTIGLLLNVI